MMPLSRLRGAPAALLHRCAAIGALAALAAAPVPVRPVGDQPTPAPSAVRTAPERLRVDAGSDTGAFLGGASGTLYGLYDARLPSPNLIEGIGHRTVSTKAQDGLQHPGGDALEVAKPLADASGGDTYIYMPDTFRTFPYNWKRGDCEHSLAAYIDDIRRQVRQVKALPARYADRIVFVPFNEFETNMFGDGPQSCDGINWRRNPARLEAAWDRIHRAIRQIMPEARIAGPNTSILYDEVKGFIAHTLHAGTLPDIVTWHALTNPADVRTSVRRFRTWEDELYAGTPMQGRHLPVNINEYAYNYHTSVPGQMIQWIAAIEDAKVDADIAFWNMDGNLSDSAVQANRGNGQWWLLHAYATMSGHTLAVTPPHPDRNYTLQGVAALDPDRRQVRVIFGGKGGDAAIDIVRLPAAFGPQVRVRVREIGWTGQIGGSAPPLLLEDRMMPVHDGTITLDFGQGELPALRDESAYEVTLSASPGHASPPPAPVWRRSWEAEAARRTGSGLTVRGPEGAPDAVHLFHTSGGYAVDGFATGADAALHFDVEVPRDGRYAVRVLGSSFNAFPTLGQGPANIFLRVDGRPAGETELFLPLGYKPAVLGHVDTTLDLTRGRHVLTLATRSLDGRRATLGNGSVDRISLTLADPADPRSRVYDIADAQLRQADGAVPGTLGRGDRAIFWVHARHDGLAPLLLDRHGRGTVGITVNGRPAGRDAFLLGGINKVVVTGLSGTTRLGGLHIGAVVADAGRAYEAEAATVAGTARAAPASLASGGRAVFGIGGVPGNGNSLTFGDVAVDHAGDYALTFRFSNDSRSAATHYNPDLLARVARISVNDGPPILATFPNSFHPNNWWEMTVPVRLHAGRNAIRIAGEEQPNWDGRTYASAVTPDILLRSRYAPNIDRLTVTPMTVAAGQIR